jgi:hypothetical protein
MPLHAWLRGRVCRAAAFTVLAALLCGADLALAAAPPGGPAPGYARIWLYRDYEPYQSLARPYVRFNGAIVAISEPGGAFYRDVAPGQYAVTVDSIGEDVNQFATVAVAAGQQVYLKIEVLGFWYYGGGTARGGGAWARPTFYTRLQLPQVAAAEIAHSRYYGGG